MRRSSPCMQSAATRYPLLRNAVHRGTEPGRADRGATSPPCQRGPSGVRATITPQGGHGNAASCVPHGAAETQTENADTLAAATIFDAWCSERRSYFDRVGGLGQQAALCAGTRPPGWDRPPGRQAQQPAPGPAGTALDHRFRTGPGHWRCRPHDDGGTPGHAALRQPGTGSSPGAGSLTTAATSIPWARPCTSCLLCVRSSMAATVMSCSDRSPTTNHRLRMPWTHPCPRTWKPSS